MSRAGIRPTELGIRANLAQFWLLVAVNALVGGMVGQERTVVPLLATRVFHLQAFAAALTATSGVVVTLRMYETHRRT